MLRVGLTGGIGSGKSTVASRLAEHGAVVIDADLIAREIVEPGTEGLAELTAAFGEGILTESRALDRAALAERAFADEESRQRLNAILHPKIGARTADLFAKAAPDAIVVHDVPLLVENGLASAYHLVLVVDADTETRLERLRSSRGMSRADAEARIAAQADTEQRRAVADVWLDNNGAPDSLTSHVDALWSERLVPFEANVRLRRPRAATPPVVRQADPTWAAQAERALRRVRAAVGGAAMRSDHIGSTAVAGLAAKDVLDLQLVVPTLEVADSLADALNDAGYVRCGGEWWDGPVGNEPVSVKRLHLNADPARAVNLHVRSVDSPAWRRALLFRDWLRANPGEAAAYAGIKRRLALAHAGDDDVVAYAEAKQPWVDEAFGRAEDWAVRASWTVESG